MIFNVAIVVLVISCASALPEFHHSPSSYKDGVKWEINEDNIKHHTAFKTGPYFGKLPFNQHQYYQPAQSEYYKSPSSILPKKFGVSSYSTYDGHHVELKHTGQYDASLDYGKHQQPTAYTHGRVNKIFIFNY